MVDVINEGPEEDRHLRTIAAHTSAYITHVRRQLRHTVPKAIVHCLVRTCAMCKWANSHEGDCLRWQGGLRVLTFASLTYAEEARGWVRAPLSTQPNVIIC